MAQRLVVEEAVIVQMWPLGMWLLVSLRCCLAECLLLERAGLVQGPLAAQLHRWGNRRVLWLSQRCLRAAMSP